MSRRDFLRRIGVAAAALGAAPLVLRDSAGFLPARLDAFEFVFGADTEIVLAAGSAAGYFDVVVRRDAREIELFGNVHALRLGTLESAHFTTRRIHAPS